MRVRIIILAIFCLLITMDKCYGQAEVSFTQWLKDFEQVDITEQGAKVQELIQSYGSAPLRQGDTVIFLARGTQHHAPVLIADFNGFLNARYVTDASLGQMTRLGNTAWYYFVKELEPAAIINYQYKLGEVTSIDGLNPNVRMSFGRVYSVVQMPGYELEPEVLSDNMVARGTVQKIALTSEIMQHERTVHVYLPAGYDATEKYPVAFFHDGSVYIDWARIPSILDNLIGHNRILPLIAVFDDPKVRGKEYRNDPDYRNYLAKELVPYIDKNYATIPESSQRSIFGGSRGGLSTLYVCHSLDLFKKCGAFSPAIHPKSIPDFVAELDGFDFKPTNVFITGSTYDFIWYPDAKGLKEYFSDNPATFSYKEIPEGHNIPAWRTLLDDMLVAFFPSTN